MNQKELKELLNEAASPDTSWQRRNEIQRKLHHAAVIWLGPVVNKLYVDTIQNRPDLLPYLFPFFAIVCGYDNTGSTLPNIDWSLM